MLLLELSASFVLASSAAVTVEEPSVPSIVVRGRGEVSVEPDIVEIAYTVLGEGRSSDGAVRALADKSQSVISALRSLDPTIDPTTTRVRVVIVRGSGCKSDEYDEELKLTEGPCAIRGYIAEQNFEFRTKMVMDAGTMVGLASRQGAISPRVSDFELSDSRPHYQAAMRKAVEDAKSKAQLVANANGASLGALLQIEVDRHRGDSIVVTGSRIIRRQETANAPVKVDIKPESIEIDATVLVT